MCEYSVSFTQDYDSPSDWTWVITYQPLAAGSVVTVV